MPFVPAHTYSLWNRYDFNYNWGVGLGVIAQDALLRRRRQYGARAGLHARRRRGVLAANKFVRAQLNVENIFGAKYYPSADGNNNITIGSPRAARFVLTTNFTGEDHQRADVGTGAVESCGRHATGPAGPVRGGPSRRDVSDGQAEHARVYRTRAIEKRERSRWR